MPLPAPPDLRGRVAIVTGGSRGIGREVCLALAEAGCAVVVAAKTATPQPTLPGTVYTVAAECDARSRNAGASSSSSPRAMPFVLDLRDEASIRACVRATIERFGRVDVLVNNASALWWHTVEETPTKKYDLIQAINARGAFLATRECLPHMRAQNFGRVICMGPPIPRGGREGYRAYAGKTAYYMSKCGMTMVALGAAAEGRGRDQRKRAVAGDRRRELRERKLRARRPVELAQGQDPGRLRVVLDRGRGRDHRARVDRRRVPEDQGCRRRGPSRV